MLNYLRATILILVVGMWFWISYQNHEIDNMVTEVDNANVALVVEKANHEAEIFEVEQTTIFDKEKEENVSEIPTDVGHHTIDF